MTKIEHLSGYQARDAEVIDYEMYELGDTDLKFRGPPDAVAQLSPRVVCLGAAQTFGCFADLPYPALLGQRLEVPVLNLGYGGAGPGFYLRHRELLTYTEQAEAVVVQVMSGRSESNSRFESGGLEYLIDRSTGERIGADAAYERVLYGRRLASASMTLPVRVARRITTRLTRRRSQRLVEETRAAWVSNYLELLGEIRVPTILLWFSVRSPDRTDDCSSVSRLFGEFPQLVNREMIDAIKPSADSYVECITGRGLPQPLFNRETGAPTLVDPALDRPDLGGSKWSHNTYYPSPEMHLDAADALEPAYRRLIGAVR